MAGLKALTPIAVAFACLALLFIFLDGGVDTIEPQFTGSGEPYGETTTTTTLLCVPWTEEDGQDWEPAFCGHPETDHVDHMCKICDWTGACIENFVMPCDPEKTCSICYNGVCDYELANGDPCGEMVTGDEADRECWECQHGDCVFVDNKSCSDGCGICQDGYCDTALKEGDWCGYSGDALVCRKCENGQCVENDGEDCGPCRDDGTWPDCERDECAVCIGSYCDKSYMDTLECGPYGTESYPCMKCDFGECQPSEANTPCGNPGDCKGCDGQGQCTANAAEGTSCGSGLDYPCKLCDSEGNCDENAPDTVMCGPEDCFRYCNDGTCSGEAVQERDSCAPDNSICAMCVVTDRFGDMNCMQAPPHYPCGVCKTCASDGNCVQAEEGAICGVCKRCDAEGNCNQPSENGDICGECKVCQNGACIRAAEGFECGPCLNCDAEGNCNQPKPLHAPCGEEGCMRCDDQGQCIIGLLGGPCPNSNRDPACSICREGRCEGLDGNICAWASPAQCRYCVESHCSEFHIFTCPATNPFPTV
ncbi:MAG: hypothetical protein GF416_08370 [Candidatus Altiarchaeales archaeon]|nr:hypothetical protein [Candidatus Altiarchaeales archaeon]MBD3417129.1 hypothetical protein [Candidatus Altiarchaeales archaeon]